MKMQHILVMIIALLCAACASPPREINILSSNFENYTVILRPNPKAQSPVLEIVSPAQGFESDGKKNGWVGFSRGKNGTILFTLDALPSKPLCTDDPANSAEWVISKVELTKNGNPQTEKGNIFGTPETGWIESAFPQMNSSNGVIEDPAIGSIAVVVQNLNNNNGAMTAYYQITARRCSDGYELKTDPGLRNGGR
jgi:hypothetical protein